MKGHERPLGKIEPRCNGDPSGLSCQYSGMTTRLAAGVERGILSIEESLGALRWKSKRKGAGKALWKRENLLYC